MIENQRIVDGYTEQLVNVSLGVISMLDGMLSKCRTVPCRTEVKSRRDSSTSLITGFCSTSVAAQCLSFSASFEDLTLRGLSLGCSTTSVCLSLFATERHRFFMEM